MLYDPHRRWLAQAACGDRTRDRIFFAGASSPQIRCGVATQKKWDEAKAICKSCPVLNQCRRDTLGEEYGVWGGYDEHERYLIRKALVQVAKKWPPERRLRWGKEMAELRGRDRPMEWSEIRRLTGMPHHLGYVLEAEWRAHVKQLRREMPPPTEGTAQKIGGQDFPDEPGNLDAWVKHNRLVSDAFIKNCTADGKWLLAHVPSGKGHVHKWVPAGDVRWHHGMPDSLPIATYVRRPDVPKESPGGERGREAA
jgi:WhiB family redox-sensing transcriptional regulator